MSLLRLTFVVVSRPTAPRSIRHKARSHPLKWESVGNKDNGEVHELDSTRRKESDEEQAVPLIRIVLAGKVAQTTRRVHAVNL